MIEGQDYQIRALGGGLFRVEWDPYWRRDKETGVVRHLWKKRREVSRASLERHLPRWRRHAAASEGKRLAHFTKEIKEAEFLLSLLPEEG